MLGILIGRLGRRKLVELVLCGLFAWGAPALAQESTTLFTHKDWLVRHEYYSGTGGQACAARTSTRQGDVLDITVWGTGGHTVWVFMNGAPWSGSFQDDLKIHVDYERWTLEGARFDDDGSVQFEFSNLDNLFIFLKDLMNGRALAMKTPDERSNIAVWSLSGSYAAVMQLFECYDRIVSETGSTYGSSSRYGESSSYGPGN